MANLNQISPAMVQIGNTIKFTVKDFNDNTVYSGKVVSICDYESARAYADVAASHQAMLAADATLDDVSLMRFLIVECYDGVRRPFGFEINESGSWFSGNAVELIDPGKSYKIKLYNATSEDATLAIRVLRAHGITCKLLEE